MKQSKHTFCRICEASCGLIAELDNGRISSFSPNKNHIGTDGFACMKGLHQHEMYDSTDRLKYPLKRVGDGYQRISWQQATSEIGAKVKQLRKVSKQSISMYIGTAAGFSILHPIFVEGFMQGVGSHNMFTSATQDCANRFAASNEMYGFPFHQPFVDLEHVKCMIVVGTNPVVSKWTFLQVAHPVKRLKELAKRGAKTVFIDPRYTESAKVGSEHLFIRPNTDVFFFLSFLNEVFAINGIDQASVDAHMHGLDQLRDLVEPWTCEKNEEVTTIRADDLKALVKDYVESGAGAIVTGTGVGMGKHGTLAHWLAEVINAVTGNLDREGGTLVGEGIFDFAAFAKKTNLFERSHTSRVGNFKQLNGAFPGAILADEILEPGVDQIKALFVTGGNPLLTMANSERLGHAFEQLELLVVTDIYQNETASLAHYVLPATSPLERPDLPFAFPLFLGMQSKPYLAATEAVIKPHGESRDEASIYTDLAAASGVGLFGSKPLLWVLRVISFFSNLGRGSKPAAIPQRLIMDLILRTNGFGGFKSVVAQPNGKVWNPVKPNSFLSKRLTTDDRKLALAPAMFMKQASKLADIFQQERNSVADRELRLITKRAHSTHNSWTQNIEKLTRGEERQTNYLYMHPDDAAEKQLVDGEFADIQSETGRIRLPIKLLAELMPTTVAIPHGWGHQHAKGLSVASSIAGANVNLLAADGPANVESVSGMAHLTGIAVTITKAAGPLDKRSWSGIEQV